MQYMITVSPDPTTLPTPRQLMALTIGIGLLGGLHKGFEVWVLVGALLKGFGVYFVYV